MHIKIYPSIEYPYWNCSSFMPKEKELRDVVRQTVLVACGSGCIFGNAVLSLGVFFSSCDAIGDHSSHGESGIVKEEGLGLLSFMGMDFLNSKWEECFLRENKKHFYLGDIVIGYELIPTLARYFKTTQSAVVMSLVAHGVLRILGFVGNNKEDILAMNTILLNVLSKFTHMVNLLEFMPQLNDTKDKATEDANTYF